MLCHRISTLQHCYIVLIILLFLVPLLFIYHISLVIRQSFSLPKQSQKSTGRSILQEGSKSLGLFRKSKTRIIAKFHRTDLVIYNHSREGGNPVLWPNKQNDSKRISDTEGPEKYVQVI